MVKQNNSTAAHISADLIWLGKIIKQRYNSHNKSKPCFDIAEILPPSFINENSSYKKIICEFRLTFAERIVLLLSLIPHITPYFLDDLINVINNETGKDQPRFISSHGTIPTVELALFILAGDDLEKRFLYAQIFEPESFLRKNQILLLNRDDKNLSLLQSPLTISPEYLSIFTTGKIYKPDFNDDFPAKNVTSKLSWKELVLDVQTKQKLEEIKSWILHGKTILNEWGLGKRIAPGYKVLFFGSSGTGKTLAATLIGKETGLDVYKIDLAMVVSKFVGETKKNIARIFDVAQNKNWILFFDEADALFGKRTELKDSHDRYANQEVAYLLQRIEDYNGVVILSSNMKNNIDEAFARRFQSSIHFPVPRKEHRLELWLNTFSEKSLLEPIIDMKDVAARYELSGGSIMNVVRYASLKAISGNSNVITLRDIKEGISREYEKEGRTI
jgi:AAA+ superfamily predicted ATPase